jgi:hypothetical protein
MNEIIHDYVGGSKQHLTIQCVYFAFRNIIFFRVLLSKKKKKSHNFSSNEIF